MHTDSQKGVSLIITFFIMVIILAVVLSVSVILYSEVKVIRNIGDSTASLFAADGGIEKLLYYDYKGLPADTDNITGVTRGLCEMFDLANSNSCTSTSAGNDASMACSNQLVEPIKSAGDDQSQQGCNALICDDCHVAFDTSFDNYQYHVDAFVTPVPGGTADFRITSRGSFGSAQRQIEILNASTPAVGAITIKNDCVTPGISEPNGTTLHISADIYANYYLDTIGIVLATVYDTSTGDKVGNSINLTNTSGTTYAGDWSTADKYGQYSVDITAYDQAKVQHFLTKTILLGDCPPQ